MEAYACYGERMMGFEPTTSTLARLRSTTELHPRFIFVVCTRIDSEDGAIIHIRTRLARLFCEKSCFFCEKGGW